MSATTSQLASVLHPKLDTNVSERERYGSVAVGTGILAGLLLGHGIMRLLTYGAAAALIHRGMTGHCHLYEKLGVDTDHSKSEPTSTASEDAPLISL